MCMCGVGEVEWLQAQISLAALMFAAETPQHR